MAELLFYILSAFALLGAAGVVLAKSPMVSILSLLWSFFCLAVIYLLAGFQFMAAAQILVYAGAIVVLFLFVVMLLNLADLGAKLEVQAGLLKGRRGPLAAGLALGVGLIGLISAQAASLKPAGGGKFPTPLPHGIDSMHDLALALFGRYGFAFEAASMLLLATMVGVILLAKRQRGPASQDSAGGGR